MIKTRFASASTALASPIAAITGYAEQNFVIVKHVGIFYIAEMFIYGGRDKRRAHRNGREKYQPELIEESFDAVG